MILRRFFISVSVIMALAILMGCSNPGDTRQNNSSEKQGVQPSAIEQPTKNASEATAEKTLYACPMHCTSDTFTDPEARCPVCGMKVAPVADSKEIAQVYACPMHPDQHSTDPNALCPICNMKLELVKDKDSDDGS
jgi:DNA-directed RNA polymerase subunit RPC12/RpoP